MGKSKYYRKFQRFLQKLAQPESTCHSIALSFSLGTLIAILPTPGFGIFIGLSLILLFKSLNKIAMVLAITIWNPFLQIPVYYASYWLGSHLLGHTAIAGIDESWMKLLTQYTFAFLLGNSILAVLISFASYTIILRLTALHRRNRAITVLLDTYRLAEKKAQSA